MCGITGVIGHNVTEEQLQESIRALKHRGPDGNGTHIDSDLDVGLAHTRLSIIDLKSGAQPLFDKSGQISLVCNGEIYDFEKIRTDLESKGHEFSTGSDSEIIIYLYKEYGLDLFEHLRGEFSFILIDKEKGEVIAARDRFGIKPLYVNFQGEKILLSSEAKGLFATKLLEPEIDPVSVRNMMSFVPIDSVFMDVESIPAGTYMRVKPGNKPEFVTYWNLDLPKLQEESSDKTIEESVEIVRAKFDEAVKLRLRADVPVGVYLSGGVDSAAVIGSVKKFFKNKLHAFTIAFVDNENFNELELAKKMAASIDAELHVAECTNESLLNNLEECLWYSEIPTANLHGVGKFILSKLAKKTVTVVLTGEGSDETFLGYEYFKDQQAGLTTIFSKDVVSDMIETSELPQSVEMVENFGYIPQSEMVKTLSTARQNFYRSMLHPKHSHRVTTNRAMALLKKRIDRSQIDGRSLKKKIQFFSIKGMMTPYILSVLGDRQEMGHAIEGRTPLLDHHLFEAARNIPDDHKIKDGVEKFVFREAMKDRIIPEIYDNKKWPFSAPPFWVTEATSPTMKRMINKYLSKAAIEKAEIFDYKMIRNFRMIVRLIPFNVELRRRINTLLLFVLNVQVVHDQYVNKFKDNLEKFNAVDF